MNYRPSRPVNSAQFTPIIGIECEYITSYICQICGGRFKHRLKMRTWKIRRVEFIFVGDFLERDFYRPQGKVMFSQAYVCPGGRADPPPPKADPPWWQTPHPWRKTPLVLTSSGGHCSGRYISYWNAFLYYKTLSEPIWNCSKESKVELGSSRITK